MPYVTCPTCGERGKIPSSLIGARIKCKKCGVSFQVSPPSTKGVEAAAPAAGAAVATGPSAAATTTGPSAAVEAQGIEVEGLDASSWALPTETVMALKAGEAEHAAETSHEASSSFTPAATIPPGAREYKLLTPRDKYFEGKFDLPRLEEALNHFAREGWVAKAMTTPHFKGYTGALEEVVVVLLERCKAGG
jgi:hypothetical protein